MTVNPRGANITYCPHCGHACKTIKTNQMTPTYREITFLCTNPRCGHIFVAAVTPVRTLEPSALKRPVALIPPQE